MENGFVLGQERRRIEDSIVHRFHQVDFQVQQHAYLEQETFWDFVFAWFELVRYYEESRDNTLGAHMLQLYADCSLLFRLAASDAHLSERRRDKAADALYQITYYVHQMALQVRRNGLEHEASRGCITWRTAGDDQSSALN